MVGLGRLAETLERLRRIRRGAVAAVIAHAEIVKTVRIIRGSRLLEALESLRQLRLHSVLLESGIRQCLGQDDRAPGVERLHVVTLRGLLQHRAVVVLQRKEVPGERIALRLRQRADLVAGLLEVKVARFVGDSRLPRRIGFPRDHGDDELLKRTPLSRILGHLTDRIRILTGRTARTRV